MHHECLCREYTDLGDGIKRIKYPNGRVYEGEVDVAGKRHGKGKLTLKDGEIQEGNWEEGLPHGEGFKVTLADGGTREGTKVDGKWEGHAVYTYVDGEIDDEEWKNGELKSESRVRIRRHSLNGHSTRRQKSDASRRTHSHTPRVLTHRKQREGSSTNSPQRRKTARSQEMQSPSTKRRSNTLSRADEVRTTPHSHAHAKSERMHLHARTTHTHTQIEDTSTETGGGSTNTINEAGATEAGATDKADHAGVADSHSAAGGAPVSPAAEAPAEVRGTPFPTPLADARTHARVSPYSGAPHAMLHVILPQSGRNSPDSEQEMVKELERTMEASRTRMHACTRKANACICTDTHKHTLRLKTPALRPVPVWRS